MRQLMATIEISRPHNMIAAAGCVFCTYFLATGAPPSVIAWPLVFTAVVTGLGNLINDFYDADIDRINKPGRPIPSGRLDASLVWRLYWVGTIVVTPLMIWLLPTGILLLMIAWEVALFLYAWKLKRVPLVGNLLISGVASSAFLGGAMLAGDFRWAGFPILVAFLLVMSRELVKGAEDVEGDRAAGASTLAVRLGVERAVLIATMFLYACAVAAPVPGLTSYYGRTYALAALLLFVPGILAVACLVSRHPERPALHRASRILKVEMFVGIAAMTVGRL